ncbi:MAG: ABC transporter permease [Pseudopedobacter saltans]|uniref:ABC transporter permease n=1 Tax=Pseudopedobacter saltans TaxID=151895 RepID=A0A2W5GPD2_9SPHI|nr:MAG: ABC transporter permease [Pseudopedobacter saltans]
MFKNYFKTVIRSLLRNKGYAALNIFGLAIGMASTILIVLWVTNEVSMDRFYSKIDRIYTLNNRDKFSGDLWAWNTTPKILGPTVQQEIPEIEKMTRAAYASFLFTKGENKTVARGLYVDSSFLDILDFPIVTGNAHTALDVVNKVVITEKFAKKLFGNDNALGQTIKIDSNDYFTVSGVLKDLPVNSSFDFDYLLPWTYLTKLNEDDKYWGNNSVKTYILAKPGVDPNVLNAKLKYVTINHTKNTQYPANTQVFAYPLSKMYLYNNSVNGQYVAGNAITVRMFSIIAALILLIACINFMNLSTARSEKRAKEVGVRKVVGAKRYTLILQFMTESVVLSILSFLVAIILVLIALPFFNTLVGKHLSVPFGNIVFWLFAILFILITGLLAGSYPAFFLSSFSPVKVLKGTFKKPNRKVNPRSILVVIQFTFAIILIISTIIIGRQINYVQNRDKGFQQESLVYSMMKGDIDKNYLLIRQELLNSGAVTAVTKSMSPITYQNSDGWGYSWPGSTKDDEQLDFGRFSTDADFAKTLGTKIVQGRDIDIYHYPTDSNAVLLNETAVNKMRLKNPIGTLIKNGDDEHWRVVGVVKDFIIESPTEKVGPMFIAGPKSWFGAIHYRLNSSNNTADNLSKIEAIFKKYNPDYPFDYSFVDENYARKFVSIKRTGTLTSLFSGLTIFISCLGLFGLAAYMAEARTKEIGVRKVLGASVSGIATLLSKDFLRLVLVSILVAIPIAWYAMFQWLTGYEYHINVPIWAFFLAGFLSIMIAILTVGFLAVRAARANPTKSLRTE